MTTKKSERGEKSIERLLSNSEIGRGIAWALVDHEDVVFTIDQVDNMEAVAAAVVDNWLTGASDAISDILFEHEAADEKTVTRIWNVLLP